MKRIENKKIDMTQGPIAKNLILYAIPIILSDFLQQLYNSIDSIIVGNLEGKLALAAVGETFFLINIFLGLFLGVSLGTTVAVSKYFGAKDYHAMGIAIDTTLKLTGILSIVFTVVGVLLVPALLELVGTTDDVYQNAETYLTIYLAGISTQFVYNMLSGILKSIGDSRRPLFVLAFTVSLNILLDYLMVGPMHLGVAGAAYATVISQLISCIILWHLIQITPEFEKPIMRKLPMQKWVLKEIFKVGIPYSLQRSIIAISNTLVISYVNFFGATTMAGWSIYQKIDQFVISCVISLGTATTTFVSQNVGAKQHDRIAKGVRNALWMTLAISIGYALFFYFFRLPVIRLFSKDPDVIAFAAKLFFCLILVHPINTFPQIFSGALRSLDKNVWSTAVFIFSYVVVRQIYLYLRWPHFQNVMIVVAVYHLTWLLCSLADFILYKLCLKQYLDRHKYK